MSMPPVSFPTQSRVLWYLPHAESLGTPYFHFLPSSLPQDKPFITTLWWRGAGLQPQNCSGLWPATSTSAALLCLLACVCTVNTQGEDCPPGASSVQILAPQDLQTILYSYSTQGNTSITAWPQTLAPLAQGGCGVFHPWRHSEADWRWSQAADGAARAGELAQMTSNASHSVIHIYRFPVTLILYRVRINKQL